MVITNCAECGIEIDTDVHPETSEGHYCFDCHFDCVILKPKYGATPLE